ncbi:hypothetical protein [Paludibacterium denitrificans]|nr:hypothetical protein [Paludibacterium denitrificans]
MMGPEKSNNDVLVSFRGVQKSYDGESLIVKHRTSTFNEVNS